MVNKTKRDTASRVAITDSSGNQSTSAVTSTELSSIDGSTTDSNITMVDADRFVINDGGIMRQLKASNVFAYLKSKLTGAISGVLTSNLTADRVVVADSDGKLSASSVTTSRLSSALPTRTVSGGTYTNKTFSVISNDSNGYTVWFAVTPTTISLKIKNSSGSNLTANGIVAVGGAQGGDGEGWYEDVNAGDYTITSLTKGQVSDNSSNASKAGLVLFSLKDFPERSIVLSYAMHNSTGSKYSIYCKVE